ncbi:hypothetical protein LTR27_005586 [Elasticomyces elasticus]|nr:hypothetical protein LTR27_005586 [Elasticomyces elasticus]
MLDGHARSQTAGLAKHELYHFSMDDSAVFHMFITWLYADELMLPPHHGKSQLETATKPEDLHTIRMVKGITRNLGYSNAKILYAMDDLRCIQLYEFGVTHKIPGLSNAALAALAVRNEELGCTTALSAVRLALELRPQAPQLYNYLVAEASRKLHSGDVKPSIVDFPRNFVQKVLKRTLRGANRIDQDGEQSTTHWAWSMRDFYIPEVSPPRARRARAFVGCPDPERLLSLKKNEAIAHLLVGPWQVKMTAHQQLLSRYSLYFRKALLGAFAEGSSKVVLLDEENVLDVSLFLDWLYTSRLVFPGLSDFEKYSDYIRDAGGVEDGMDLDDSDAKRASQRNVRHEAESSGDDVSRTSEMRSERAEKLAEDSYDKVRPHANLAFSSILDLYIFADRRGVQALQNDIMNRLAAWREAGFPLLSASVSRVNQAYEFLPPKSPMLRYLVEEAGFCWGQNISSTDRLSEYPSHFVVAVLQTMLESGRLRNEIQMPSWRKDLCSLHEHTGEPEVVEEETCMLSLMTWHKKMCMKEGRDMEPVKR